MTTGDQRLYSGFNGITIQDDPRALLPLLKSQLPHSIPLLRRLQHNLAFPSETARLLTTFPGVEPPSEPWLAAYVDLPRGRETQMTIYSSLERESVHEDNDDNNHKDKDYTAPAAISTLHAPPETLALVRALLLALLSYTKTTLLPGYLSSLTAPGVGSRPPNAPGQIPPPPPQAFLIGNLHTGLMALLKASGIYTDTEPIPGIRIHRYDNPPYVKYLFRGAHAHSELDAGLPPGYRFQDRQGCMGILPHHYALVRSRTHLPRSDETLSRIPAVAAYVDRPGDGEEGLDMEMPIAWVFLGLDGSLATLFVEPEHRRKGIAEALSREVMRRGMAEGGIWREVGEEGEVWVHANVLATNGASRRVLEKLGGEIGWTNTWTVVELQS